MQDDDTKTGSLSPDLPSTTLSDEGKQRIADYAMGRLDEELAPVLANAVRDMIKTLMFAVLGGEAPIPTAAAETDFVKGIVHTWNETKIPYARWKVGVELLLPALQVTLRQAAHYGDPGIDLRETARIISSNVDGAHPTDAEAVRVVEALSKLDVALRDAERCLEKHLWDQGVFRGEVMDLFATIKSEFDVPYLSIYSNGPLRTKEMARLARLALVGLSNAQGAALLFPNEESLRARAEDFLAFFHQHPELGNAAAEVLEGDPALAQMTSSLDEANRLRLDALRALDAFEVALATKATDADELIT